MTRPKLVSVTEAMKYFKTSRQTILNMIKRGDITALNLNSSGKRPVYRIQLNIEKVSFDKETIKNGTLD
jgi:hypothetical protein